MTSEPVSRRIGLHSHAGELDRVASLSAEVDALTEATGSQLAPYGALHVVAWRGREAEASAVIGAAIDEVVPRGEALGLSAAQWATAPLYNGLGRYQDALPAARQASKRAEELGSARSAYDSRNNASHGNSCEPDAHDWLMS